MNSEVYGAASSTSLTSAQVPVSVFGFTSSVRSHVVLRRPGDPSPEQAAAARTPAARPWRKPPAPPHRDHGIVHAAGTAAGLEPGDDAGGDGQFGRGRCRHQHDRQRRRPDLDRGSQARRSGAGLRRRLDRPIYAPGAAGSVVQAVKRAAFH